MSKIRAVILTLVTISLVMFGAAPAFAVAVSTGPGAFTYTGTWGNNSTEYWSNQTGATATLHFRIDAAGATIKLRGYKHSGQGIEAVSVDGAAETLVSMYSSTYQPNTVVYTSPGLAAGTHTLKVRITGTKASASSGYYGSVSGADVSNGAFVTNTAPVVSAGADQAATLPNAATLSGSVADDGLPKPVALTSAWSQVSGPGVATFANPAAASTSATFDTPGTYVLRLTGNDGALSASDDVSVTVAPEVVNPPPAEEEQPPPAPSGVTLDLDWDTCNNTQWTTGNGNLEAGSPAHQLTFPTTPTRDGTGCAARFETHNASTDKVSNGTFRSLDAKYDSQEGTVGGTDFVYGLSFHVPAVPRYQHIWELHNRANIYNIDGDLSLAPHAILLRNGQLQYREMTGQARWNGSSWTGWSNYQDQKVLDPAVVPNQWYDVTVHIKASEGSDGLTEVFVRKAGQSWPATPAWVNNGPSMQWVPGGLDPNVPTKRSNFDSAGGYSGLYLEAGLYSGGSTWGESFSPMVIYMDNLRRYTDLTAARSGFPQ